MKNLLLILIGLSLFAACKDNGSSTSNMTADGYKYKVLKKGSGEKIKDGDVVTFEINILSPTDSVLQASSTFPRTPTMLVDSKAPKQKVSNPILTLLETSSVGDNIEIIMPKDSMNNAPPAMAGLDYVKYVISIMKAENKDVLEAKEKAKKEKLSSRESEVATVVSGAIKDFKANKAKVVTLDSGLKYILHEEGKGDFPEVGKTVSVNYYGVLLEDGKMFDNSFKRGSDFQFPLGQGRVIKGWDEGIAKLRKGSKATLIIPSGLGYGAAGSPPSIPGGATLAFYVEVGE